MCSTTLKASELSRQRCSQCTIYIICIYDKPTFSSWVLQEHIQSSRFLLIKIFFPLQRPGLHPQPLNNVFHFFKHIFSLKQHCKHFNVVFFPPSRAVSRFATALAIRYMSSPSNFTSSAFSFYDWKANEDAVLNIQNVLNNFYVSNISCVPNTDLIFLSYNQT